MPNRKLAIKRQKRIACSRKFNKHTFAIFIRMASRSNSNAAATQAQRKATSDNKRTSSPPSTSKLGLASTDLSKFDGKRQLLHTDSGYISPTVAPTSNGNSPQTPSGRGLQNANFQIETPAQISSRYPTKPTTVTDHPSSEQRLVNCSNDRDIDIAREQNHNADTNMQKLLAREGHPGTASFGLSSLPTETVSVSTVQYYC